MSRFEQLTDDELVALLPDDAYDQWREVAGHEATTGTPGFPTLLHTRVMPRTAMPRVLPWSGEHYVDYWRGNAAIGRYIPGADALHGRSLRPDLRKPVVTVICKTAGKRSRSGNRRGPVDLA